MLYRLARELATMRSDGSGSKFPTNRIPMGLLEYMVGLFDSETSPHVCVLKTLHTIQPACILCITFVRFLHVQLTTGDGWTQRTRVFGTKWSKLHTGPMWSGYHISQGTGPAISSSALKVDEVLELMDYTLLYFNCSVVTCNVHVHLS